MFVHLSLANHFFSFGLVSLEDTLSDLTLQAMTLNRNDTRHFLLQKNVGRFYWLFPLSLLHQKAEYEDDIVDLKESLKD